MNLRVQCLETVSSYVGLATKLGEYTIPPRLKFTNASEQLLPGSSQGHRAKIKIELETHLIFTNQSVQLHSLKRNTTFLSELAASPTRRRMCLAWPGSGCGM